LKKKNNYAGICVPVCSIVIYQIHDLFENNIFAYSSLDHTHFPSKLPDFLVNIIALVSLKAVQNIFNFLVFLLLHPALHPR